MSVNRGVCGCWRPSAAGGTGETRAGLSRWGLCWVSGRWSRRVRRREPGSAEVPRRWRGWEWRRRGARGRRAQRREAEGGRARRSAGRAPRRRAASAGASARPALGARLRDLGARVAPAAAAGCPEGAPAGVSGGKLTELDGREAGDAAARRCAGRERGDEAGRRETWHRFSPLKCCRDYHQA